MAKKRMEYIPSIAVPPGETLREYLKNVEMTQVDLARRTGLTPKHISGIIKGTAPITQETALKLEYVLGVPASFWNNLEVNYRETLTRLKAEEDIAKEEDIAREIPYADIARLDWVEPTRRANEKVVNLRSFFGVASLTLLPEVFEKNFAFRISDNFDASNYALATWLRKGEIEAKKIQTEPFNKNKLERLIPTFRSLTLEDPKIFFPKMVQLCASCGIALVLVPLIPKTYICGATNWVKPDKAIVQLSVRGARADIFWFTFFHEVAHIMLHDEKENHLQGDKNDEYIEDGADNQARDWLISPELYKEFVQNKSYTSEENVKQFARQIGVHPCIVVGRLANDKKIKFSQYSHLRPSFQIVNN